jgi:phosphoglycolate phosphatase-like HAD superfamily hydrolase
MALVMFDIDGTLTKTAKVDAQCFVRSFMDVFGIADFDTDWSHYRHTTDPGIFREIFAVRTGRLPTTQETSRFREHFVQLLTSASLQSPFAAVAGAYTLLSRLRRGGAHQVSLATGCWSDSARVKMASAGMCFDDHVAASADDALDRESIMRLSLERAAEQFGEPPAGTVYVGDGIWDARACRVLGIRFIGIGSSDRAAQLASEGAVRVFRDFSDGDLFLESVDEIGQTA